MGEAQPQRILMTTDTVGGVWTFTLDLTRELVTRGTEVVLAALGGEPSAAQIQEAKEAGDPILLTTDFRLEWMPDAWASVEASRDWLLRVEREYSPDLVHLNSFGHGGLPLRAPVVLTAHSSVTSWWRAVHGKEAPAVWDRYRHAMAIALNSADVVTAPTAAMAATLETDCLVIPNGRDASQFQRKTKEPFVFTAGRLWDEAKNTRAVASVASGLPWPVYGAGDAGDAQFEGCRMLGPLSSSEMKNWLSRASIYALPALYEPFGYSVLEAALSGCSLVLGDIPSLREVWGDTATFVPPRDEQALRSAIEELIERPFDNGAYHRALEYSSARMAQRYLNVYAGCLCAS